MSITEQTEFYTITTETKVVTTLIVNESKVFDAINEYVDHNLISGRKYKLQHLDIVHYPFTLTAFIMDVEYMLEPDETLDEDPKLSAFFKDLAAKCKCTHISLPYYYYGK